jgi:hypothetical protein
MGEESESVGAGITEDIVAESVNEGGGDSGDELLF